MEAASTKVQTVACTPASKHEPLAMGEVPWERCEATESFRLVTLDTLVRMKLTAFGDKDRTHLRDLIEVGLVDANWIGRLPSELAVRLQILLDTPEGIRPSNDPAFEI